jgi:hypothetical protein
VAACALFRSRLGALESVGAIRYTVRTLTPLRCPYLSELVPSGVPDPFVQ